MQIKEEAEDEDSMNTDSDMKDNEDEEYQLDFPSRKQSESTV